MVSFAATIRSSDSMHASWNDSYAAGCCDGSIGDDFVVLICKCLWNTDNVLLEIVARCMCGAWRTSGCGAAVSDGGCWDEDAEADEKTDVERGDVGGCSLDPCRGSDDKFSRGSHTNFI